MSSSKFNESYTDGQWHHFCITWENVGGKLQLYVDGIMKMQNIEHIGHTIQNGAMVLGQVQHSYKGGFQEQQSFKGNITSFNMWDKVLSPAEISDLVKTCHSGEGNVIKWSDLKHRGEGDVKLVCSFNCFR